jgi:carboxypeptidase T
MDISQSFQKSASETASSAFKYTITGSDNKEIDIHPSQYSRADEIDLNHDRKITDEELKNYLERHHILKPNENAACDEAKIMSDCKLVLQGKPLKQLEGYHTYDEMVSELKDLSARYPGLAELASLGKTSEGRDIWALKMGNQNSESGNAKPGIVITGGTHANEVMTVEVPLHAARQMLELYGEDPAMKRRLDNATIWLIPMLNPDGHEYVRNTDPLWRKNRDPITETACDGSSNGYIAGASSHCSRGEEKEIKGYGVDINRNYYDGKPEHFYLYRPEGDSPCSSDDDKGASDTISSEEYRGPGACSENEIKAIRDLELNKDNNIKGVIDFHSYGDLIFYPWGDRDEEVDNVAEYKALADRMKKSISDYDGTSFTVMQGAHDYHTSGGSLSFHQINGIMSMTLELGASFFPEASEIAPMQKRMLGAQMDFLDHFMKA